MPLITQADLEKHLQIDVTNEPDAVVTQYIEQAQATADNWCQQPLEYGTVTEIFDADQPSAWRVLNRFPISTVTSVTENDILLTEDDDYLWYADGRIRRVAGTVERSWSGLPDATTVVYTAGYGAGATAPFDTPPDDLILGIVTICGDLWRYGAQYAAQGAVPVKSVTLTGSDTITYATEVDQRQPGQLSQAVKLLLAPYMRRHL